MLFTTKHIMHYLKRLFKLIQNSLLQSYTNDILLCTGRILLTFKQKDTGTDLNVAVAEKAGEKSNDEVKSQLSHFLPTSRRIMQFSNGQV